MKALAGLLLLVVAHGALAQQAPPAIHGRVTVAETNEPVRRARVGMVREALDSRGEPVLTDGDGRFRLTVPDRSTQTLVFSKGGYASVRVEVPRGEGAATASPMHAAVAGTLVDDFGEPFQGARVQAMEAAYVSGLRVALRLGFDQITDDRGRYRVFGLLPGAYYLVAAVDAAVSIPGRGRSSPPAPVYYPGTTSLSGALPVQLDAGHDAIGLDLTLPMFPGRESPVSLSMKPEDL